MIMIWVRFWILIGTLCPMLGWAIGWAANMNFFWWDMVRDQDRGAFIGFCGFGVIVFYSVAFLMYQEWKKWVPHD